MFCAVRFLKVSCFYGFVIILIFPIVCNMTSLAVIGARPLTPPSPQRCPPPAIFDKRSLRRFFRSGTRCQQNVATYPGGQRRNKDRAAKKDTEKNRKTYKSRRSASKRFLEWNWLQICWFTVCRVGTIYHPLFLTSHAHCVCGREILLKRVSMRVRSLDTLTANLGPPLSSEAQREVSKISNIWTKVLSHSPSCPVDPTRWTDDVDISKSFCREL